jgi:hypothetical protein
MDYFNMLNGSTYMTLVRHFWVRAQVYDRKVANLEETEIGSSIMGIPVFILEDIIFFVLRRPAEGNYKGGIGNSKTNPWNEVVNQSMFNNTKKGAHCDLSMEKKMLLKIQNENLLPKGGGSDQPSLEHIIFLHYFITKEKANVPKYILKHMMKELRENQDNRRR